MITASIVTYHHPGKEIGKVLECVLHSPVEKIYIIDNSLNDGLRELEKTSTKIRYIHNANIGYGGAHNIGLRYALETESKYHVIINPDIYFENGTIEALARYMDEHVDTGAVMPQVRYPDGEIQYLCKLLPTPFDLFGRRFLPFPKLVEKRNIRYELRESGYDKIMNIPCLSGCFMFLRTAILPDVGVFDERYFMYGEDFDFYRRIHRKYKTVFFPFATVIHEHQKGSYKNKKLLKIHIRSMIRYFNKWGWIFDAERKQINDRTLKELNIK